MVEPRGPLDPASAVASAMQARERGDAVAEREILERALAGAAGPDADGLRAEMALVLVDRREGAAARLLLMQCSPAVRASHPAALLAEAWLDWREKGRSRETRAAFEAALAAMRKAGNLFHGVRASVFIAEDERNEGDAVGAAQRLRAALEETTAPQHGRIRSHVLLVLADLLMMNHADSAALEHAEQCLALARAFAQLQIQTVALRIIATLRIRAGLWKEAGEAARLSYEAAQQSGVPHFAAIAMETVGEAHLAAGESQEALQAFRRCVAQCREQRNDRALCTALPGLSRSLLASGDVSEAERCATEALHVAKRLGNRETEMECHACLTAIAEARGDFAAALAAERERHSVEADLRFRRFSERLDRFRAGLGDEAAAAGSARADAPQEQRGSAGKRRSRAEAPASGGLEGILGTSEPIRRLVQSIELAGPTDASVLILGETGVGKELVARALHARSRRRDLQLVTVNCAAIPATLVESQLFGHEKGAFSGAVSRVTGRFERADGGTIFLDEIGELPLELQVKLLRVLQEGEFERLGESVTRRTDVRVVAATNRDLRAEVLEGTFRADLFYRLAVLTLEVPSLRERRDDIPLLVSHFTSLYEKQTGRRIERIPEETMQRLTRHDWPGNVRELANAVQRAMITSPGAALVLDSEFGMPAMPPMYAAHGPAAAVLPAAGPPVDESMEAADRAHILRVLETCSWRVAGRNNAAERLGMPPSTLRSKMATLGISRETPG